MRSFPWDSIVEAIGEDGYPILDRACSAEDLREVVETFFTNGVFLDSDQAFQVTPDEGMSVIVSPGKCLINGTVGYEQSERKLALQGASSQDRIDTIVLRWNANIDARLIDIYVRTGVAADVPTRPALVRNETVYELGIADIYVAKNTGSVVQQRITDTRLENARCGAVLPFASIDTTTFYAQIQAAIDAQIGELQAQTDRAVELAQSAIDGTTAGNLQNQIDALNDENENLQNSIELLNDFKEIAVKRIVVSASMTLSWGALSGMSAISIPVDVPSGYNITSVFGYSIPHRIIPERIDLYDSSIIFAGVNSSNSSINGDVRFRILCTGI